MDYNFLDSSIEYEDLVLPNSDKINNFLLKNNKEEVHKAIDFLFSDDSILHVHGFMGTGKRQFINYIGEFLNKDVIKLEYYCKASTVSDDILLNFIEYISNLSISRAININAKISTLNVKFEEDVSAIKKPFVIILHSADDVLEENIKLLSDFINSIKKFSNVKIIISTKAMQPKIIADLEVNKKIFLKALTKEIFVEYLRNAQIKTTDKAIDDFYKYTRGYYYYTALSIKIIQTMNVDLVEFLQKYNQSEMTFDSFLGVTYVNIIPATVRNYFWFLRTIRHGLSTNALAVFEIYDEFALEYLKSNLMIFQVNDVVYVQDFFIQKIDISIPDKTEIKLHKYIIGLYEKQLKERLKDRVLFVSRQAMRAEIEYHNKCIKNIESGIKEEEVTPPQAVENLPSGEKIKSKSDKNLYEEGLLLIKDKKYTEGIEKFLAILDCENIGLQTVIDVRSQLAKLYKIIGEYSVAEHYYELLETYYREHLEFINLNYLYYDMTDLYFKMYKNDRALDTIKRVIYSVDTPKSLLVNACILSGNIYTEIKNYDEAYIYYKKALESVDENTEEIILAELYFKFALANDDKGISNLAFEYYNKCISTGGENPYRIIAYSNLASCYYENGNYTDALSCFKIAYEGDKSANNYDGIYYTSLHLAKIFAQMNSQDALDYFVEAKQSAEFLNDQYLILEVSLALGDYYYNDYKNYDKCLIEYYKALNVANDIQGYIEIGKIERRIEDMKARMLPDDFAKIESKYGKKS